MFHVRLPWVAVCFHRVEYPGASSRRNVVVLIRGDARAIKARSLDRLTVNRTSAPELCGLTAPSCVRSRPLRASLLTGVRSGDGAR